MTNAIAVSKKTIGKYELIKCDMDFFMSGVKNMVKLMELIENIPKMKQADCLACLKILNGLSIQYTDWVFEYVITRKYYFYSTVSKLSEILKQQNIQNNAIKIYEKVAKENV